MTGIIITKVKGRVDKDVVNRLRCLPELFADDDIALLIQQNKSFSEPDIQFEITKSGPINAHHIHGIIETLFVREKGKGIGATSVSLRFKEHMFKLPDDMKKCIKFFKKLS